MSGDLFKLSVPITASMTVATELRVLFLSGGLSQRMGRDKALLEYSGQAEGQRWWQVFESLGLSYLWSVRAEQYDSNLWPEVPRLIDRSEGQGPLGALLAAYESQPELAWLLVACDWPLLGARELQLLVQVRQPAVTATAYSFDSQIEPLFTIYEPEFCRQASQAYERGERSLQHLLKQAPVTLIQPVNSELFLNANDGVAFAQALARLLP